MNRLAWLWVGMFTCSTALAEDIGVRIRLGVTDKQPTRWDGSASVTGGKIAEINGWRFEQGDKVTGPDSWQASTRQSSEGLRNNAKASKKAAAKNAGNPPAKKGAKKKAAGGVPGVPVVDNGVILRLAEASDATEISVKTAAGSFAFKLGEIPLGSFVEKLDGAVEIERCAATQQLSRETSDDDFPALAAGDDGTVYSLWVSFIPGIDRGERARSFEDEPKSFDFLAAPTGGDRIWMSAAGKDGKWSAPLPVTEGKQDIYKIAASVDGKGRLWVVWSEQKNGNFDIWARTVEGSKLGEVVQLTTAAGNDICPVAVTDEKGRVWIAWQGDRDKVFRILTRRQNEDLNSWADERLVSTQSKSCWYPAIAATRSGPGVQKVAVSWDTYEKGDYDVWVRQFDLNGNPGAARPAANTSRYEARSTIAFDAQGQLFVAWEESGATWGKDWGALDNQEGIPLYADRQIGLSVLGAGGQWMQTEGNHISSLPGVKKRRNVRNMRAPVPEPESETRKAAEEAETRAGVPYNNISRLAVDREGRPWLLSRTRQADFRSPIGSVWVEYAGFYDGKQWQGPILLPHSDNLLYNVPAVAPSPDGGLIVAHSSDHRMDRPLIRRGLGGNGALESHGDPYDNDIYISRLAIPPAVIAVTLKPQARQPDPNALPHPAAIKEWQQVQRCRDYRATVHGKQLQIIRGEFHRHTEISGDGGNDGPLEDMWRYAIDVASMDWLGCGDHDNGAGREYPWWLTQKTTDAFRIPGAFDPPFTYERSVRYPEGHRNVIFTQRGVRTLPRLPISDRNNPSPAPDTQMLYKYLRHFGGICSEHTSATSMGTDWRDNDPVVEPMVEIYQGARQNYERPGAPRSPTANDSIGGWEPLGFVNLALLKGYRLAFQSSSDHRSTHISYALVYSESNTRQAMVQAMKKRHVYAATDNIIADFRCQAGDKEYFMGEEFSSPAAPALKIKLIGTSPFAKVTIVKDDKEVHLITPHADSVDFTWTDPSPTPGKTSYYYVRGEQTNQELVWASPMWIKYEGK